MRKQVDASKHYVYYGPYGFVEPDSQLVTQIQEPDDNQQNQEDADATVVRPEITIRQEIDHSVVTGEELIKVTAEVTNSDQDVTEITSWHYRIFSSSDGLETADETTCRDKYIQEKETSEQNSFLINPWHRVVRSLQIGNRIRRDFMVLQ